MRATLGLGAPGDDCLGDGLRAPPGGGEQSSSRRFSLRRRARRLWPCRRSAVVDLAVVGGVLAFSVLQLLLGGGFGEFAEVTAEPDGLAFALVLLSALALLWRDQHPRAVVLATLALSLALAALQLRGARAAGAGGRPLRVRGPSAAGAVVAGARRRDRGLGGAGGDRGRRHPVRGRGLPASRAHLGGRVADR